ncbi:hypothetical protein [Gordonia alkanivorans]|uniref:hypothetical protein n=1 Tax=Gordonia alkanivorans TaxID=84096 RepID=UPI0004B39841|nr:hypothetical protein [Gordonia alkanivorans]
MVAYGLTAAAVMGWVIAFTLYFWGDPWDGLTITVLLGALTSAAVFVFVNRGFAAAIALAVASAATAVWAGWSVLNWGGLLAGLVLPTVGIFGAATVRRTRVPRLAAAVAVAVVTPLLYLVLGGLIGEWAVLLSAIIIVGIITAQIDLRHVVRVRQASRRSGVPMRASSPFTLSVLAASPPSASDSVRIAEISDAHRHTADRLADLPAGWFVFHSRLTETGHLADHVVVGPSGVVVVRSDQMPVRIEQMPVAQIGRAAPRMAVTINGDPIENHEPELIACRAAQDVDSALMIPGSRRATRALFVAKGAEIEEGSIEYTFAIDDGGQYDITYVTAGQLVPYLLRLPHLGRDEQFTADLAAVVDYVLPRAE